MKTEKVYSPVEDKKIRENLNNSPIWKTAIHESELATESGKHNILYEYIIKFDGLTPTQVTGIKRIK